MKGSRKEKWGKKVRFRQEFAWPREVTRTVGESKGEERGEETERTVGTPF